MSVNCNIGVVFLSSLNVHVRIIARATVFADAASKHALQAFCDTLRAELHDSGIHVSVLSPGYVQTQLSKNAVTATGQKYGGTWVTLLSTV